MNAPFVSINMPIYNRSKWLPLIYMNIKNIAYPHDKLEFVILDDSNNDKLFKDKDAEIEFQKYIHPIKLKYVFDPIKKSIGEKRNKLCKLSSHKIIACMDSDDLYLPTYLPYAVSELNENKLGAVGSAEMLFVYPHLDWRITGIKCLANRQIHEATLVYTKKHFKAMGGFQKKGVGEGSKMFDFMNPKMIKQLEVKNIMVCICHKGNTCPKDQFEEMNIQDACLGDAEKDVISKILSIS
jgi:glycosyltransferase involved in cell wall biosynthesis